ncbi:MAG: DUF2155 domain-containing protein [Methyloceanibacter sp.]|uniref:DUF2155 domain-containing protein n=1 Tax=Methyloceanibacter sp. TaxID=1965321 RepID=UPI003D6CAB40
MVEERTGTFEVCGMMRRQSIFRDGSALGRHVLAAIAAAGAAALPCGLANAELIKNPIAVFAALDKVTGRISHLEIPIDQTVEFGALKVTPRVCDTRPPTQTPHTASFVEVDEIKLTGEQHRIFTGWMFAESPGLHAVEHPVFDVWLTSCKTPEGAKPVESTENAPAEGEPAPAEGEPAPPAAAEAPPPAAAEPPPPAAAAAPEPDVLPWLVPNASSRRR